MRFDSAIAVLVVAASVHAAGQPTTRKAADPREKITFLSPDDAGIDFTIQGEYEGGAGDKKWGAQVIALGDGNFHAVFEPGGLPGDGWDAKTRYESEGRLDKETVHLEPADKVAWTEGHIAPPVEVKRGFEATIEGGTLTGKTDAGEILTLKKTLRHSPAEGAKPPDGAIVLFDGSNADAWTGTQLIEGNLLKEGGETKQKFTDYTLHVEFRLPFKPFARSQARGNSGVYNQHRYEVQVLDSFGVMGMDNQCGGIYTKNPPAINMCYPPLSWQTYDIEFTAPRYEAGKKVSLATITVKHNGVLIQDHFKIDSSTASGQHEASTDAIGSGPLYLQEHGNPVYYRNVWIVEKK